MYIVEQKWVQLSQQKYLNIHKANKNTVHDLCKCLRPHFSIDFDPIKAMHYAKAQCNICNKIFHWSNFFILMRHLRDTHQMDVFSNRPKD